MAELAAAVGAAAPAWAAPAWAPAFAAVAAALPAAFPHDPSALAERFRRRAVRHSSVACRIRRVDFRTKGCSSCFVLFFLAHCIPEGIRHPGQEAHILNVELRLLRAVVAFKVYGSDFACSLPAL